MTTEYRESELIDQMRAMADCAFIRRGETIKLAMFQWPTQEIWKDVALEYNQVARERNLPEISL
jgi:hypothetical protein